MNIKQIKALAQILAQNDLSALEINEGETHIRLERTVAQPAAQAGAVLVAPPMPAAAAQSAQEAPASAPVEDPGVDFNDVFEAKSPLVGVFYAAPSPGAEPFVRVGSRVKKGDVLCIVEAMKLMNEIQAERDGEIVDICAHDGDVVEFGQTLFKLYER
ncbi:MAG TPA: acetyl-CoA carboxylase biotin carboxyl carrier protein [Candidatus Ornithocaccomicrobium faecavium]|uniref:Biotin carboxyl carrier protein of acetyl-CoA carboxylase n=1 Tax=Candidatus Ornithocaccomicrobium faecavium TaxID=2840890 RepID=A0A9D1TD76_9FIRM|nr:acetyl-CoA carboxylase biotin carboxyl carrier protein [Clostridiales bacterium]HIV27883.1 acetyl-CoA carboxylase biotin carboxyl carrier protein [Candidatus Ornithocaccomicrobium faecavium]